MADTNFPDEPSGTPASEQRGSSADAAVSEPTSPAGSAPLPAVSTEATEPAALVNTAPQPAEVASSRPDPWEQLRRQSWPRAQRQRSGFTQLSWLVLIFLCAFIILSSLSGLAAYQHYRAIYDRDTLLATQGIQRLRAAEVLIERLARSPLDAQTTNAAGKEFSAALDDFSRINQDLGQIPAVGVYIPHYGSSLRAALDVLPLAVELAQAGILGCNALSLIDVRLGNPLDAQATGMTPNDLRAVRQDVDQVAALLDTAAEQVQRLQPADLQADPRIAPAIATFRDALPTLRDDVQTVQSVLAIAPAALGIGTPTSYLVEQLDSTELRPGGGFIGTYGVATVSGGRLSTITMTDVDLIDKPFEFAGHTIPYPPAYAWFTPLAPGSWSLRDSNLDADFPTAARYAEQNYHIEGGAAPVQGVIAITPWLIVNALKITGPIYVSEYHETITAQNLIDRIHYHQLKAQEGADYVPDPTGHSSLRKRFTSYLFDHFLARVRQIAPTAMPRLLSLAAASFQTKDLQIYLNASAAESLLQRHRLASTIDAPVGDSLFVVDSNQVANKANDFMTYTLVDRVALDTSGTAVHHTTLTYAWPISQEATQNDYGSTSYYLDYLRIYLPPGSSLQAVSGWRPQGPSQAFGRQIWGGFFSFFYGQTLTIALTWSVPHAATKDAAGWHYRYLIQRQPGVTWHVDTAIALPACARVSGPVSGVAVIYGRVVTLNPVLTQDRDIALDYTCTGA